MPIDRLGAQHSSVGHEQERTASNTVRRLAPIAAVKRLGEIDLFDANIAQPLLRRQREAVER